MAEKTIFEPPGIRRPEADPVEDALRAALNGKPLPPNTRSGRQWIKLKALAQEKAGAQEKAQN